MESVRTVCYAVGRNGFEQTQVKLLSKFRALVPLMAQQWLERFECSNGSVEADFAWLQLMLACGLCHNGTNEIVI